MELEEIFLSPGPGSMDHSALCPVQAYGGERVAKALGMSPGNVRYFQE